MGMTARGWVSEECCAEMVYTQEYKEDQFVKRVYKSKTEEKCIRDRPALNESTEWMSNGERKWTGWAQRVYWCNGDWILLLWSTLWRKLLCEVRMVVIEIDRKNKLKMGWKGWCIEGKFMTWKNNAHQVELTLYNRQPWLISVSGSSAGHWSTKLLAPGRSSSPYLIAAWSLVMLPAYSGASIWCVTFIASSYKQAWSGTNQWC